MPTAAGMISAGTDDIYPARGNPYYIVAPHYIHTSAGVRVLHLLCHSLNRRGQVAYIVLLGDPNSGSSLCVDLLTPTLTLEAMMEHYKRGSAPIVVYPETVCGNPLRSPCVVRYVMNFPGLLGGDKAYSADELCFSYSKTLAKRTHSPENVLYLPPIDTSIFYPPPGGEKRRGSCFYADKYKAVHNGKLMAATGDAIEITRDLPTSQTPQEIAELFRRSKLFYTYENTALATEAVLCGCPAVFLPNPHLIDIIAKEELGTEGYAWGTDPGEIARARATVLQGAENYRKRYANYWCNLDRFIALTQKHGEGRPYTSPVLLPDGPGIGFGISFRLPYPTIREIAREVWFERQRWGLPHKIGKWLKTRSPQRRPLATPSGRMSLRLFSVIGASVCVVSSLWGARAMTNAFLKKTPIPEFSAWAALVTFLLGLIIIVLGIIG
jgi:hypothetical protein